MSIYTKFLTPSLGVPKDESKALELYQAAAGEGHVAAQTAANALSNRN